MAQKKTAAEELHPLSPLSLASYLRGDVSNLCTFPDIITKNTTFSFSLPDLIEEFCGICQDFKTPLGISTPTLAIDFAVKILFEIGPASSKKTVASAPDREWRIKLRDQVTQGDTTTHKDTFAIVRTFKNAPAPQQPKVTENYIIMSVKQACLLAMYKFNEFTEISADIPLRLTMTPLAGATFSVSDVSLMLEELAPHFKDLTYKKLLTILNSSCQTDGHFLEPSDASCAYAAAFRATMYLNDENVRQKILLKIRRQYLAKNKNATPEKLTIFSYYATGGLPVRFLPIMELFS